MKDVCKLAGLTEYEGRNLWIITKDHIEDGAAVDTGSSRWEEEAKEWWNNYKDHLPVRFKMYDDDGELYYEGRMEIEDFHPLDDFGMPNSGCTELWYSKNNQAFKLLQEEYEN